MAVNLGQAHRTLFAQETRELAEEAQAKQRNLDIANARKRDRLRATVRLEAPSVEKILALRCFVSASRSAIPWKISNRMLETTEVAHAEVFVAEEPNLKSLTPKAQLAVCLTGAWIISPAFFQGMAACQKFARTSQIYRRLHVTSSFHEHHKSLLDVLKVVCACRGSQTKMPWMWTLSFVHTKPPHQHDGRHSSS